MFVQKKIKCESHGSAKEAEERDQCRSRVDSQGLGLSQGGARDGPGLEETKIAGFQLAPAGISSAVMAASFWSTLLQQALHT